MSESFERPIRKANPGTFQSDEEVIRQFVVRERELATVLEVLKTNVDASSCQHVLLVAPRGRGKTMLLARVAAELRTNARLARRLLPVRFMEESHEIFDMADFWLECLFYLAKEGAVRDSPIGRELLDTHAALAARARGEELTEPRARAAVLDAADRLGRKLVFMVENLQNLCDDVDESFGWKLRETLQSEPRIMLLATATSRFEGLDDATEPFFELFRSERLDRLDTEESRRLWRVVSGDDVLAREIRPLQILTGGSPRLLVYVADFARNRSLRQLMEQLVKLIDDHTEYFRTHLEGFAKTERRVYLATLDLWQPSTPREITTRARLDVRTVSTMLSRLVDRGAVIAEGGGRKRLYSGAERLYGIYYKLRRERDEAVVVSNLIRFMAAFYSAPELAQMTDNLSIEAAQSPSILEGIERAIEVSRSDDAVSPEALTIFEQTRSQAVAIKYPQSGSRRPDDLKAALEAADRVIERLGSSDSVQSQEIVAKALVGKGVRQRQLGDCEAAIATCDEAVSRYGDNDSTKLQLEVARALVNKGIAQGKLDDFNAEIATYDQLVSRYGDNDSPELQLCVARALVNKGISQLGDCEAAIATYDQLVSRYGGNDSPELQLQVAMALVNKGYTQGKLGDFEAEIATGDQLVSRYGDSGSPELQLCVAMALVNKGNAQDQLGDSEAAIATYDEAVSRCGDGGSPELQLCVAKALVNKGDAQGRLGDSEAAIATYDEAVSRYGDGDSPELQQQVARTLVNKGDAQGRLGDSEAAIATYDQLVRRYGDSGSPELQPYVAKALVNKGDVQGQHGDFEAAIATYDEAVSRYGDGDSPELQQQVAKALVNKGITQGHLDDFEATIATYDQLVRRYGDSDSPELQRRVAGALYIKGISQRHLGDRRAAIATYGQLVRRYGDSDSPELQLRVAMALFEKVVGHGHLGDSEAAIATCGQLVTRYGDSDSPELQLLVAKALFEKGVGHGHLGDSEAAIATYGQLVTRYGDSDLPELQLLVAKALFNKGITQGQRYRFGVFSVEVITHYELVSRYGASDSLKLQMEVAKALANKGITQGQREVGAEIATYDQLVSRYGASDSPELRAHVAMALNNKGVVLIRLGRPEEALRTCDELERACRSPSDSYFVVFRQRAMWLRTKALLLQGKHNDAIEAFRNFYVAHRHGSKATLKEIIELAIDLAASGCREPAILEIVMSDEKKSDELSPLVVALRRRAGEVIRAPVEVMEVADDIIEQINAKMSAPPQLRLPEVAAPKAEQPAKSRRAGWLRRHRRRRR